MFKHRVCNIEYDNELNHRLNQRYFPSKELQPNFDPRPSCTKYTLFHSNDNPIKSTEELRRYPEFKPHYTFYSGTSKAPVQQALQGVDTESLLRNQFIALQKNDHAYYIPPLESDLYVSKSNVKDAQLNKDLYESIKNVVNPSSRCQQKLSPNIFNNSTRHNLLKYF